MGYFCSGIIYSFYFFILFILVCFFICWETEKTPTCKQTGVLRFFLFCSVDLTPQHTCKQACVRAHTHTPHTQTYFCYIVFFMFPTFSGLKHWLLYLKLWDRSYSSDQLRPGDGGHRDPGGVRLWWRGGHTPTTHKGRRTTQHVARRKTKMLPCCLFK